MNLNAYHTRSSGRRTALERIGVALVVLAIAIFFLATIREGTEGGDDDAMYILHARNIVSGAPYAETGYILNPNYPGLGPESYPPGYPLLLAPLYAWQGLDLRAMKIQSAIFFIAFLAAYFALVRRHLRYRWAMLALVATGLSPIFWAHKDNVSSDFAFLLFVFAGLSLFEWHGKERNRGAAGPVRGLGEENRAEAGPVRALAVSALLWFAAAVRSIGLVAIPAVIAADLIRLRTMRRFTVLVAVLTAALALAQAMLFPGSGSYLERVWPIDPGVVWYNALKYATAATGIWSNGYLPPVRLALVAATGLLAAWTFARRLTSKATVLETFVLFYAAALLVFPGSAARYLFPLIPIFFFYLFIAVERLSRRLGPRGRVAALAFAAFVVLAVYAARYTTVDFGPLGDQEERISAERLYRRIADVTDRTDVLVARRPRDLCLHTGRSASVYHDAPDRELWAYLEEIGADYLVLGPNDTERYRRFVERSGGRLREVYRRRQHALLEVSYPERP
ncbi:MAG: hypothetical protein GF400_08465 [Candidatus Eisenbacteria bacterium]|nr:hypothetical protein [Candidatus Eisenbacteria bacterium]